MTVQVYGEFYTINTVEDLSKVQSMMTEKFFEEKNNEEEIIDRYFFNTPHIEIYDRISDYPDLMSDIVDRAVENETDYQTLEEAAEALQNMGDALECIYETAREWT